VNVLNHGKSKLWTMVFLCFLANILCFVDRINISIAAPFMMEAFGWSKAEMGVIFSAFFAGYVLFMIPCGVAVDRLGAYRSMAAGMVWGSLFTCVTPFFSRIGSISLCRFLVGMGQGFNFPAVNQWIARHVGVSDRAKVQGLPCRGSCWPR
jgi:MFS family permease